MESGSRLVSGSRGEGKLVGAGKSGDSCTDALPAGGRGAPSVPGPGGGAPRPAAPPSPSLPARASGARWPSRGQAVFGHHRARSQQLPARPPAGAMGCDGRLSGLLRRNLQPTLTYWSVFFSFGLCIAFLGPTLLDLRCQTHSSLSQISWVFFSQQLCLLLGSVIGGVFKRT